MLALRKPRPTKPKDAFLGVGEFFGRRDHLVEGLRHRDALLLEQFLVVVEDEVVDRPRQREHLPLVVLGVLQARGREVAFDEVRRGEVRVLHEAGDVGEPAALFELPLLHVIAQMNDVEARLAGGEFDHRLLALLLLGDLLRLDLDAGQFGEFLDVLLQIVAARTLGEDDLQLGAGIFLPLHLCARGKSSEAERAGGSRTGQNCTARDEMIFHCCYSPWRSACFVRILAPACGLHSPIVRDFGASAAGNAPRRTQD